MMTKACNKKRKGVCVSSESGDTSTEFEIEESRLSKKDGVTSIPTCEHQSSYELKAESMNTRKIRLCTKVLTILMDHKCGWIFNQPVDPVLYGLPDYFDIIRNPMDLGTVQKKLTNKQYLSTDEFAADVRLTFSNAMKYNPPSNEIHVFAKQLNGIFDSKWESMKGKFRGASPFKEQRAVFTKFQAIMDSKSTVGCTKILRRLMKYSGGWIFSHPVDPVLYGIPDYFHVIHNPMDLGTVKKKLTNKQYVSIDEFAADVKLTFSNAMKYNPPGNQVHAIAKQLNGIFDSKWESMKRKFRGPSPFEEQKTIFTKVQATMDPKSTVGCSNSKPLVVRGPVDCSNSISKKPRPDALSFKVKIISFVSSAEQASLKGIPSKQRFLNHFVPAGNREASLNCSLPFTEALHMTH